MLLNLYPSYKGPAVSEQQYNLLNWQIKKMQQGLQQAQNDQIATADDVLRVFNKCKK